MAVKVEIRRGNSRARRALVEQRLQRDDGVVHGAAQMRQVRAAEQAVPVCVVRLRLIQQRSHFGVRLFCGSASRRCDSPSMRLCIQLASG